MISDCCSALSVKTDPRPPLSHHKSQARWRSTAGSLLPGDAMPYVSSSNAVVHVDSPIYTKLK